jgi:hypothetical protein
MVRMSLMGNPGKAVDFAPMHRRLASLLDDELSRPTADASRLAGALRVAASVHPPVRLLLADAARNLAQAGRCASAIHGGALRALVDSQDKRATSALKAALAADDCGGLATFSAAGFSRDPALAAPLAKAASSSKAMVAFGAEFARFVRRESSGERLAGLAPRIKESHRIALCVELFVPYVRGRAEAKERVVTSSEGFSAALKVLRDAERHLGRWLVLAEVATQSGDLSPLAEARHHSEAGADSAQSAWKLVAWALEGRAEPPSARPTVELVARLSDRPSADRDTTFLFRMARAKVASAKPMLEGLMRAPSSTRQVEAALDVSVRAAHCLALHYARPDVAPWMAELGSTRSDSRAGLVAAALADLGDGDRARAFAEAARSSDDPSALVWAALVEDKLAGRRRELVTEESFRRLQWGWVE